MNAEIERRISNTEKVLTLFRSKPNSWIGIHELAAVGGFSAWRTRVADARAIAEAMDKFTIEWNGQTATSAYMYRPLPLGPSAETERDQLSLGGWR